MNYIEGLTSDELRALSPYTHRLKGMEVRRKTTADQEVLALLIHVHGHPEPFVFLIDRPKLIESVRRILSIVAPTTEDRILETLQRIEKRLSPEK